MAEKSLGFNARERRIKSMPKVSQGKCLNFSRCKGIDDLADGLCTTCWDKTSYKDDLDGDDAVPKRVAPPKSSKRGNMRWFLTI